jgi:cobalt-precorrin-5B (C1)-methyltransferase
MTDSDLREPDLPRTMKVRQQAPRRGLSTGANAAAAAKAALLALTTGQLPEAVEIPFLAGTRHAFPVHSGATDGVGTVTKPSRTLRSAARLSTPGVGG